MCQEASRINRNTNTTTNTTINTNMNVNNSTATTSTEVTADRIKKMVEKKKFKVKHVSENVEERESLITAKDELKEAAKSLSDETLPNNIKNLYSKIEEYCNINSTEALALDYKPSKENLSEEEYRKQYRKRYKSGSAAIRKELQKEAEYLNEIKKMLIELKKDDTLENIRTDVEACLKKVKKIRGELSIERTKQKKVEKWKLDDAIKDEKGWKEGEAYDFRKASCKNKKEKMGKIFYKGIFMWDRRKEPLFAHKPNIEDIQQGQIGDCYLLSALATIAKQEPDSIQKNMLDNEDGTVTVRFFDKDNFYKPVYITVSKKVPRISASGALWVKVMEKAMAAFNTYEIEKKKARIIEVDNERERNYGSKKGRKEKKYKPATNMIEYGLVNPIKVIEILLGREVSEIKIKDIPKDLNDVCKLTFEIADYALKIKQESDGSIGTDKYTAAMNEEIKDKIKKDIPKDLKDSFRDAFDKLENLFVEFVNLCEKEMPNIKDSNGVYSKSEIKKIFKGWVDDKATLIKYIEEQDNFWNNCKEKFGIEKEKAKGKAKEKEEKKEEILKKIISEMFIQYFKFINDKVNDASIGIYNEMSGDYSEYATNLYHTINKAVSDKKFIIAGSKKIKNEIKKDGIAGKHGYSVLETEKIENLYFIKLRNPWGEYGRKYTIINEEIVAKEYKHARDGQFLIELNDFIKMFEKVDIYEAKEAANVQLRKESGVV